MLEIGHEIKLRPTPHVDRFFAFERSLTPQVIAKNALQRSSKSSRCGADILAHTAPADELWSESFAKSLAARHIALTPTLTLWNFEATRAGNSRENIEVGMGRAAKQLGAFSQAGGQVLFGTDVGYINIFDTAEEFAWMSRAGMSFKQILASLTTNPAQRFGYATRSGRIANGMDADLVVLRADPARDATAFSQVHCTIRSGQVIYSEK